MNILGLTIARTATISKAFQTIDQGRGWYPLVKEPYSGAWQRNEAEGIDSVLSFGPVFACQTLIASDIAKCRLRLVEQDRHGIWNEVERASPYWPFIRKPNSYQNRIQFFENWVLSKLSWGNTYMLKARDARGIVVAGFILDPQRVRPMVSDSGEVFYELRKDVLSGQPETVAIVPAREIIHDRFNCLFHPLVGLSPLFAATLSATQGLRIQRNSARFWKNGARPSGVLTAPADIGEETAKRLKEYWETNFSGDNVARIAILGDGLKYEPMSMTSVDAQLVEQLGITGKEVCSVYHVPPFKVGVADPPSYNNVEALDRAYYSQCLQRHFEDIELCLDEGLALDRVQGMTVGTEFDLDDLLRMDTASQIKTLTEGLKGIYSPDEARRKVNLPPQEGGSVVYLQQQNYSLAALAKRDAKEDPFHGASAAKAPGDEDEPPDAANDDEAEEQAKLALAELKKGLADVQR